VSWATGMPTNSRPNSRRTSSTTSEAQVREPPTRSWDSVRHSPNSASWQTGFRSADRRPGPETCRRAAGTAHISRHRPGVALFCTVDTHSHRDAAASPGVTGLVDAFRWLESLSLYGDELLERSATRQALSRLEKLPRRDGYACPRCKTAPPLGDVWKCGQCQQPFDTFQGQAVCPHCGTQLP